MQVRKLKPIIFVGNARCYHTMDWYRTVRDLCPGREVAIITDLVDSEGHKKIVDESDLVYDLFNIDGLLLRKQSRFGNLWRNLIKFLFIPMQTFILRGFACRKPHAVFHAHTMYYMFVCWLSGVEYIGTPQGSEVLVRPGRSMLYKRFAVRALCGARLVTVDSSTMRDGIRALCGVEARVVQNGVDVHALQPSNGVDAPRDVILSIRGFTSLYRIDEILVARNSTRPDQSITFIYPFWDADFKNSQLHHFNPKDSDLGRLMKTEMINLLWRTRLVISIPSSDSSPRSVYEAIFAGAPVAATYAPWVDALTPCMRDRLYIVDLTDPTWFEKALEFGDSVSRVPYIPSVSAIDNFDQLTSMRKFIDQFYCD